MEESEHPATHRSISARVRALDPWFHHMELGGVPTAPNHPLGDYPRQKWRKFAGALPADLAGRTVLDIGCNGGFYALEMKRRGADRVVGIDVQDHYLAQAELAAEVTGLDLELRKLSVFEVGELNERFDVVLFLGVLYHLRHPLLALDRIREHVSGDLLVFQSMLRGSGDVEDLDSDYPFSERRIFDRPDYPKLHFVEESYAGDPGNWWIPNAACAQAMLRDAGFEPLSRPEEEVFLCRNREAR